MCSCRTPNISQVYNTYVVIVKSQSRYFEFDEDEDNDDDDYDDDDDGFTDFFSCEKMLH